MTSVEEWLSGKRVKDAFKVRCPECGRVFDLLNETDAREWAAGHDCEVT